MVKNINRKDRLKRGLLKLGEVANMTGTLPSTVRYYSNMGLLKVSDYTQGRYRLFNKDEALARMAKIRSLKNKKLTLTEIKRHLYDMAG